MQTLKEMLRPFLSSQAPRPRAAGVVVLRIVVNPETLERPQNRSAGGGVDEEAQALEDRDGFEARVGVELSHGSPPRGQAGRQVGAPGDPSQPIRT